MTTVHARFYRRRMVIAACGVIAAAILIAADQQGWLLVNRHDDLSTYHGMRVRVRQVIDGDTIEIDVPDALNNRSTTRVGLWGVNCPEPARREKAAEPLAVEATAFVADRLTGATVTLWLESHQPRDTFGRVLAHVELSDRTRLNESLLEAGLAKTDERWPHSMLTRYAQLQLNSRRRGVGLWNPDVR